MKLPVGIDDFKELNTGNFFTVGKTRFVRELLDEITRLHRYSKSSVVGVFGKYEESEACNLFYRVFDEDVQRLLGVDFGYDILFARLYHKSETECMGMDITVFAAIAAALIATIDIISSDGTSKYPILSFGVLIIAILLIAWRWKTSIGFHEMKFKDLLLEYMWKIIDDKTIENEVRKIILLKWKDVLDGRMLTSPLRI